MAPGLRIHPRDAWGAELPPKGPLTAEDVRFLIVHHSASGNGHTADDVPVILRRYYTFHTGPDRRWNDIAYNFLVDSEGGVWEGRQGSLEGPVAGDATGGNQGYTQLVCLIGDTEAVHPTEAALESLEVLLAWLADRYEISTSPDDEVVFVSRGSNRWPEGAEVRTSPITGHRSMSQTSCPGRHLNEHVVGDLMGDVEDRRAMWATTTTSEAIQAQTTTTATPPVTSMDIPETAPASTNPSDRDVLATSGNGALAGAAGSLFGVGAGIVLWRRRRMR